MTFQFLSTKLLSKTEMKQIRGGLTGTMNVCGDPRKDYDCSVYKSGETLHGTCAYFSGRCKCDVGIGNYETANDTYYCESKQPDSTLG